MSTTHADEKRRVTIPDATPGDVFEIRNPGNGDFVLQRISSPVPKPRPSYAEALKTIIENPIEMRMSWEELRKITREP